MLFKKRSAPQGRIRPTDARPQTRREPVFSYHASRSVRTQNTSRNNSSQQAAAPLKRQKDSRWRQRLYTFGVLAVILLLVGMSLRLGSTPKVVTVDLDTDKQLFLRDRKVYEQAAAQIFQASFFNSNKLTVNTNGIIADMRAQFPELVAVSVTLPVAGSQPVLYLQPAQPRMVLSTQESGMFLLDGSGRALMNAVHVPNLDKLGVPVVADESGIVLKEGQVALPSATVAFISEVAGQLRAKNVETTSYVLPPGANELHVRVSGAPYYVKFNTHGNAREAAGNYLAVKSKLDAEKKTPKEYVDVRVENRAYFK
jgi:hypothetical protein